MKSLYLTGVSMLCCLLFTRAAAQALPLQQTLADKPALFARLPEKFLTTTLQAGNLFASGIAATIKLPFANNLIFEGVIIEKVQQNPHAASLNVRLINYDGALLTLSKITQDDLSVTFTGRIVNIRYGDVYAISSENDQLIFTKQNQSLFLVE